ncbi:hypothetical protein [Legionella micdadei]|uniref:FlgJ-like protein n=1 Tax=Legionella micdadei TaxID=451 RepID=A0A098GHV6_LEGMI|nr:hypothetical protein [Legionella micdadei]ARG96565.1 hypothetical protein B6N58_02110 [Legionella micdadei]ARG99314.1 hypothetical protein B6V88_02100 [Legionella micdadei]KTD27363.1 putative FlgJ-like protein [Legionella micdadei]NSL18847.1 hypothetical protein [Legionella micdadei]CEG62073.1 conserved protein of unknown function [Legionella micdadei]
METNCIDAVPHPQLLEALFAFRSRVSSVFRDVLGIHEISHMAISRIDRKHKILSFSSTPAMEFNLFSSNLWRYDKSYHTAWYSACGQANWQSLYSPERYDELYYLKQIKHCYPIGYSLAAKLENDFFIYSLASSRSCDRTRELFASQHEDFYKIGQYCSSMLSHLFQEYDCLPQTQVEYETSN